MSRRPVHALAAVVVILIAAGQAVAQATQFTVFTGAAKGELLDSPDGFGVSGLNYSGVIATGPHCPAESLTVGPLMLGPTFDHFHGFYNGQFDFNVDCGWGHVVEGDYRGIVTTDFSQVRTFVLPHILESSGNINNTQNTFDTQLFMTYSSGLGGGPPPVGAGQVELFIFDNNTGGLLNGANGMPVGNGLEDVIGSGDLQRKRTVVVDDLITSSGGGFPSQVVLGFGVVVVHGDTDNVNVTGAVTHAKTGPFDLSVFSFEAQAVNSPAAQLVAGGGGSGATLVREVRLDGIIENPADTDTDAGAVDTLLKAIYVGGLVPGTTASSVSVELCLFNDDDTPMLGLGGAAANPFTFTLDGTDRVLAVTVQDLILAAGGFASALESGYALFKVTGDFNNFVGDAFVIQTGSGPNDLLAFSQLSVIPEPTAAVTLLAAPLLLHRRRRS